MYKKISTKKEEFNEDLDFDDEFEDIDDNIQNIVEQEPKRRGRPKKTQPVEEEVIQPKKKRGIMFFASKRGESLGEKQIQKKAPVLGRTSAYI